VQNCSKKKTYFVKEQKSKFLFRSLDGNGNVIGQSHYSFSSHNGFLSQHLQLRQHMVKPGEA